MNIPDRQAALSAIKAKLSPPDAIGIVLIPHTVERDNGDWSFKPGEDLLEWYVLGLDPNADQEFIRGITEYAGEVIGE